MKGKADIKTKLYRAVIEYARKNHADEIDKAYEYFFEEEYPEDFLEGIALDIAFINFEDYLICDWKTETHKTLIDLYINENKKLDDRELKVLNEIKDSVISLYEVSSTTPHITLKDLILDTEFNLKDKTTRFSGGDIFAGRFFKINRGYSMSRCVYPYGGKMKKTVLEYFNKQFNRYIKNENPDGTKKDFLKFHSDVFNTIWVSELYSQRKK
ncbi:MAG: hypothetical protein HY805_02080 [Nitrospirae bacterium]|nr:hypothetical protein [Nitrospirota bacterium]